MILSFNFIANVTEIQEVEMFCSSSVQETLKLKEGVRQRKQMSRETLKEEPNPNKS